MLVVLTALVAENARLPKASKRALYKAYAAIAVASLAEWGGIFLNGAPMHTVFLHKILKCMDYALTPTVVVFFIQQTLSDRRSGRWIRYVLIANAALQICSIFTGWTFYIDEANYYRHGPYFNVYTLVYLACIVSGVIQFMRYGSRFKKHNRVSLFMIIAFMVTGIAAQEVVSSDIRTVSLTLAISSVLLLMHTLEFNQLENDEHLANAQKQLETDPLTGLYSRYAYSEEIERLKTAAPDESLTVFSIDVNHLKKTNDTMGHLAGDELICGAAQCLKQSLAPYGKVYRTGGDEFIAFLHMDREGAQKASDDLKQTVSQWHGTMIGSLSLSFSYARSMEFPGMDIEKLIVVADQRMYDKKNRYYISSGFDRRHR